MRRSGKVAVVTLLSVLGSACHKKTLQAPPPLPPSQTPASRSRPTSPPARTTPPEASPQPPPQPEFRLGASMTPEELQANNALIDRHLRQAARTLGLIERRNNLTADNRSAVAQIRGFMDQAREMRTSDVVRARSLAERADVLAQDLLTRLK